MKKSFTGLTFATLLVGLTMSARSGGVQPPPQAGSTTPSAELADRVKTLELQAKTLEEKYAHAATLQAEYRGFYEKAFNTQTYTIWAIGILLTAMLAVAGLIGFRGFERQTEAVIKSVVSELRASMEGRLMAETQALATKSEKQVSDAIDRLTKEFQARLAEVELDMEAKHLVNSAAAFAALNQHGDAVKMLRTFLSLYAGQTGAKVIPKHASVAAIQNLFTSLGREEPGKFREAAQQELSRGLYGKLREEVILAAHERDDLRGVLSEIGWKLVPIEAASQESAKEKTEEKGQA